MSAARNIKKSYGDFTLDIPELEIKDEGITSLFGPSGSGKTSLLRVLTGLDPCPSLEWIFKDEDLAKLSIQKRKIGFVFQDLELFPHASVIKNIQLAGEFSNSKKWKTQLDFLIFSLDLNHCRNQKAFNLSRGEAQRTALARALIIQPRILFLDEPFSSLDEINKNKAQKLIQKMIQHYKIPALLISHDRKDVYSLSHTVIQIQNGKKIKKELLE